MIIKLCLFWLVVVAIVLPLAWAKKSRETILRVFTFLALFAIAVAAYLGGLIAIMIMVTLILVAGLYELSTNYGFRHPWLFVASYLPLFAAGLWFRDQLPWLVPAFLIVIVCTFAGKPELICRQAFARVFCSLVLVVAAVCIVALFRLDPDAIFVLFMLPVINDVSGYFAGRAFGRTRPFKNLSPQKTLAGYLGSFIGLLGGFCLFNTLIPFLGGASLKMNLLLLGIFFVFGNAGDLLFSKIKRSVGTKDFSSLLPGHGGVLDRFDNILTVAPLVLLVFRYAN